MTRMVPNPLYPHADVSRLERELRDATEYAVAMRAALDKAQTALRDGDIGAARNIIFAARHDAALAKNPKETPSQFHSTQCAAQAKCPTRYACHRSGKCLMATELTEQKP